VCVWFRIGAGIGFVTLVPSEDFQDKDTWLSHETRFKYCLRPCVVLSVSSDVINRDRRPTDADHWLLTTPVTSVWRHPAVEITPATAAARCVLQATVI